MGKSKPDRNCQAKNSDEMGDFYVIFIKLIGNLHQTYTLSSSNIYAIFMQHSLYVHRGYRLLT